MHRGLRSWVGFKQATVKYERPPRARGQSKYNLVRLLWLAVSNMVKSFPLTAAGWMADLTDASA